ncbi:hypothetical protein F4680DRAFT_451806 [Xylaria scruposa]|nr:hypothetical protein F4680DRAFT_451806 [Xylaria scruposa]
MPECIICKNKPTYSRFRTGPDSQSMPPLGNQNTAMKKIGETLGSSTPCTVVKNKQNTVVPAGSQPKPDTVDIVMTHGPPWLHLNKVDGLKVGGQQRFQAIERVQPRLNCFGHIHEAWGAERVTWVGPKSTGVLQELDEEGGIDHSV